MKTCNACQTALPFGDFPKHKGRKDGHAERCKKCQRDQRREEYANNAALREKIKQAGAVYYAANRQEIDAKNAVYRAAHLEEHNARSRNWYQANPETAKASRRASTAKWIRSDKGKAYMAEYYTANIEAIRTYQSRPEQRTKKHGYYMRHQAHYAQKGKERYEADKPKSLLQSMTWVKNNRERSRMHKEKYRSAHLDQQVAKEMRRRLRLKNGTTDPITTDIIAGIWHKQKGQCIYCRTKLGASPKATDSYHVDHIHPVSKGGTNEVHNLQCLCPPCNWKKGAKLPHVFAQQLGRLF